MSADSTLGRLYARSGMRLGPSSAAKRGSWSKSGQNGHPAAPVRGSAATRARGSKGSEFATRVAACHAANCLRLCPASGAGRLLQRCPAMRGMACVPGFGLEQGASFGCTLHSGRTAAPISEKTCASLTGRRSCNTGSASAQPAQ